MNGRSASSHPWSNSAVRYGQHHGAANRNGIQPTTSPLEEPDFWWSKYQAHAADIVTRPHFDVAIGALIALNAISIGIEQSLRLGGRDLLFIQIVESIFLVIYITELCLRVATYGTKVFHDRWVVFDMFLVGTGVVSSWVLEPMSGSNGSTLAPFMLLRIARLLRLTKTMRLFARFKEFYMLIRGFFQSMKIIVYTFLTLFVVLYVFACVGTEVISGHSMNDQETNPEFHNIADEYFRNLPVSMLTLMQFICWDNMSGIWRPLIDCEPLLALYFVPLIFIVSILLVNLVTAVILSSTFEQNLQEQDTLKRSKEAEWAKLISDLKHMFLRLDEDKSGQLSRSEILKIDESDQERLCEALGVNTPVEVFEALDADGSGQVSINEFFDGIWDVVLAKAPLDLKRMEKQVETMHWRLKVAFQAIHEMHMDLSRNLSYLAGRSEARSMAETESTEDKATDHGVIIENRTCLQQSITNCDANRPSPKQLAEAPCRKLPNKDMANVFLAQDVFPTRAAPISSWAETLSLKLKRTLEGALKESLQHVETAASVEAVSTFEATAHKLRRAGNRSGAPLPDAVGPPSDVSSKDDRIRAPCTPPRPLAKASSKRVKKLPPAAEQTGAPASAQPFHRGRGGGV